MKKEILMLLVLLVCRLISFSQAAGEKMLYIVDSIPQITDAGEADIVTNDEIAGIVIIRNKDSLKLLGWPQVDGITYIFTYAYRQRPDSIKQLPGLLQMTQKEDDWYFRGRLYSGRYIDYYISGRIKDEGVLESGKLNGQVVVYYLSGTVKSKTDYKNGVQHGYAAVYFKNGALMQKQNFSNGKSNSEFKQYYSNGQADGERKPKKDTRYDTSVAYYSTGKIKSIRLIKNGEPVQNKQEEDKNYYTTMFLQSWNRNDTKEMEKNVFHLWLLDSNSMEARFDEGVLLEKEFRFDEAVHVFDKLLETEPLDRNNLLWSGMAHLKRQHAKRTGLVLKDRNEVPIELDDLLTLPEGEQKKSLPRFATG